MKKLLPFIVLIVAGTSFGQSLRNETTYEDKEFPFSVNYSSSWRRIDPTLKITRLRLLYKNQSTYADLNINAINWPELRNDSPESYVNSILKNRGMVLALVRFYDENAELLEARQVNLDGRAGVSIRSRLELEIEGVKRKLVQHQLQTLLDGNVYTLTFFVGVNNYESIIPEFEKFIGGFKIREQTETFTDTLNSFSISYPAIWKKGEPNTPNMRLKLRSENGNGGADISVLATDGTRAQRSTPNQVIEYVLKNPEAMISSIKQSMPDVELISVKETKIAGLRAIETIYKGSIRSSANNVIGITVYVVSIPQTDVVYTITSRSPTSEFDVHLPGFKRIVRSFTQTKK